MNLGAVRDRAQELRNSLDEMARALAFNAHNIRWYEVLARSMPIQEHLAPTPHGEQRLQGWQRLQRRCGAEPSLRMQE